MQFCLVALFAKLYLHMQIRQIYMSIITNLEKSVKDFLSATLKDPKNFYMALSS